MKSIFLVFMICITFVLTGCKKTSVSPRVENIIGTVCSVNAFEYGTEKLYNEIFARLDEIDSLFNVNKSSSLISQINLCAGKTPVAVSEDFIYVLNTALRYAEKTDGAFDPTIGPLVKLWGINTDHAKVPTEEEIKNVLQFVDWKSVKVVSNSVGNTVFLEKEGMSLDLGGIAKGFAADEIITILKKYKVKRAIVDLGGNVYVFGNKKDNSPWNVGIKNPFDSNGTPALVLSLNGGNTVVTSGVYERFFEKDGIIYHHILDVRTGRPAIRKWSSTTIVTDSSMDADALSTISFLLGFEQYQKISDQPVVFIDNEGSITASASLNGRLRIYDMQNNSNFKEIKFR